MATQYEMENIKTDLTGQEKYDLNAQIEHMIDEHRENRQEINRLVFECTEAMTEGEDAQTELSNKGFLARLAGNISGSNAMLQNKINDSSAVAQYASQQILQKLAEQNLMSFELVTAVNNKLNASVQAANMEFNNIYNGLNKFFRSTQSNLVRMSGAIGQLNERVTRLENKTATLDRRTNLLNWENSIEYLEFNGVNYLDLDDAEKIVCLSRDFYDITEGEWETSDLLLLKKAMSVIEINPRNKVNFLSVIEEISEQENLMKKFLGYRELKEKVDPSYLVSTGAIQKFQMLEGEESYLVDSLEENLGGAADRRKIRESLVQTFMRKNAGVNLDTEIDNYDLVLDFIYNMEEVSGSLTSLTGDLTTAIQTFLSGNKLEAFKIFNQLANAGNGRACYWISLYYLYGYGVCQLDEGKSEEYIKKGCELGDPVAIFSNMLKHNNEQEELISCAEQLINSSERNEVDTQTLLGDIYRNLKDYKEAVRWYQRAADQGDAPAQYNLGVMYANGDGVDQNNKEAVKWYRKAADQGDMYAQYNLGVMYANGDGVDQNYKEAVIWYQRAADQGYASAQYNLGIIFFYGDGVEQNYEEAEKWFQKAADQGDADAQKNLGVMYENGYGVEQNYEKAVKWYQKAADQENVNALNNLADKYMKGIGCVKDQDKALELYKKAVELRNGYSAVKIGDYYLENALYAVCDVYGIISDALSDKISKEEYEISSSDAFRNVLDKLENAQKYYKFAQGLGQSLKVKDSYLMSFAGGDKKDDISEDEALKIVEDLISEYQEHLYEIEHPTTPEPVKEEKNDGCFITTAVCSFLDKADDCEELTVLRDYRDNWLRKQPGGEDLVQEYYQIAPTIVDNIDKDDSHDSIYLNLLHDYIQPCIEDIKNGNYEKCKKRYINMVLELKEKYYS